MANLAIVIGVDRYATALTSLRGAVEDAIDFASWLINSGEVVPNALHLGLAPDVGSPPVPAALGDCMTFAPTMSGLDAILIDLLTNPIPDLDRLYFFFSGHGAAVSAPYYSSDAICLSGFDTKTYAEAFDVSSLKEVMLGIGANKRFIFLDGCRDAVYQEGVQFGRSRRSPRPAPGPREAYILRATSAGRKAAEVGFRGLFSRHLCRGLRGEGCAKRWDADADQGNGLYRIRWGALSRFVADEVAKWAKDRPGAGGAQLVTIGGGEMVANDDPVFGEIAAGNVPLLTVKVTLTQPDPAPGGAEIVLRRAETAEVDRPHNLSNGNPAIFQLPPSAWVIWAKADGYQSRPRQKTLLAYDGSPEDIIELDIVLPPDPREARPAGLPEDPPPDASGGGSDNDPPVRAPEIGIDQAPIAPPVGAKSIGAVDIAIPGSEPPHDGDALRDGWLEIRVAGHAPSQIQPLHQISVSRESGTSATDNPGDDPIALRSDLYRVKVTNAEGAFREALVFVPPDETVSVDVPLPFGDAAALTQALISGNKGAPFDGFAVPSERLGPIASASLATVVTIATAQSVLGRPGSLSNLGLAQSWPHTNKTGVQVVIAIDEASDEQADYSATLTPNVRLWQMFDTNRGIHERLSVPNPGVALSAAELSVSPGGYWLELQDPDRAQQRGFKLATVVLPDHVTLVIRNQVGAGRIEIFQFAISRNPANFEDGLRALVNAEALQRSRLLGRDPLVDPVADAMTSGAWFEPFSAMALAAVLMDLGNAGAEKFGWMLKHLERAAIETVDTLVLRGVAADRAGTPDVARGHFENALHLRQAPTIDRLLDHLDAGARLHGLGGREHRWIVEKMDQAIGHPLWTLRNEDDKKKGTPNLGAHREQPLQAGG